MYFGDYLNNFKFGIDQKCVKDMVKKGIVNSALKEVEDGQKN